MTDIGWGFVPSDRQELRLPKSVGAALAELVKRWAPFHTAKQTAKVFNLEPATAQNLVKGHASERTLTKMVHVQQSAAGDAWELWDALGAEVIGETRSQYEERKLRLIIEEAERAQQGVQRLRTRRERLERLAAALVDLEGGPPAVPDWRRHSGSWSGAHDLGEQAAREDASTLAEPKSFAPGRRGRT